MNEYTYTYICTYVYTFFFFLPLAVHRFNRINESAEEEPFVQFPIAERAASVVGLICISCAASEPRSLPDILFSRGRI